MEEERSGEGKRKIGMSSEKTAADSMDRAEAVGHEGKIRGRQKPCCKLGKQGECRAMMERGRGSQRLQGESWHQHHGNPSSESPTISSSCMQGENRPCDYSDEKMKT